MILDFEYSGKNKKLIVSEITDSGDIKLNYYDWYKPKKFVPCSESDPDRDPVYMTWDKKPVKKEETYSPNRFSIYEFIDRLPAEEKERLFKLQFPKTYFVDIETEILPTGFVEPTHPTSRVLAITVVNGENIWVLALRPLEKKYVEKIRLDTNAHFKGFNLDMKISFKSFHAEANPEKAMLHFFFSTLVPKMPVITGWNFLGYDWTFLVNRCRILKLNPEVSSFTGKLHNIFGTPYEVPAHRLIVDYMEIYKKWDTSVKVKETNSLNWVGEKIVGVEKIHYDGNLQELYENDFTKYIFYNVVDTVLVQLIHEKTRLIDIMFSISNLAKIRLCDFAYKNLNTTLVVTEGFLREEFREKKNIVLCKDDSIDRVAKVKGGWVKTPHIGMNEWITTFDFASLYPHQIMQFNISPETFQGYVMKNKPGYVENNGVVVPLDPDHIVCRNGAVFSREESVTVEFLKTVYSQRKHFKKIMNEYERKEAELNRELKDLEAQLETLG
jgi:DNA polymerase elongation subunit (family B)